jgi:hypothetical protein
MRNDQTTGSPRSMRLNAEGDQEIQALAILLAVGLCRAIAAGSIPAAFACRRFLKPALLKQLKDAGAPSKLVEVLELGSELEFVE